MKHKADCACHDWPVAGDCSCGAELDAAKAEIERLRADNERLLSALLKIANLEYDCVDDACEAPIIAVAALEGKDG